MAEISKTTDQALTVLLELSENGPMTPAELSRSLKMNRTVVQRLLATLHRRGFVTRLDNGYVPGAVLLRMAEAVQPELRASARAILAELSASVGETIVMHIADGDDAVVLDQIVAQRHVVRVEHRIGSRHPLTRAASGRALLAFLSDARIRRIVDGAEAPATLREQLDAVRTLGYAMSHDELQYGVHGLAVPVLLHDKDATASIAVLVPTTRASGLPDHLDALRQAANRIAATLSGALDARSNGGVD